VKIAFVHRSYVDYMAETPYTRAVGGSESALCYLAAELAKLGHEVRLVTNTSTPGPYRGVECLNYKISLTGDLMNAADVVVISNEACAREMRDTFRVRKPLVLWVQHADDQPAIEALQFTRERKSWNGFAYVSDWQAQQFFEYYWMPSEKGRVMRNAIAPVFADLPITQPWFRRGVPPTLIYTSMPYRGLDVLLDAFPAIRAGVPGTRLRVYSSMARVQVSEAQDEYADLYRRCTTLDGVDYIGPVGQAQLANEMADAAALAYPSTYPETSCIAAMEAMAVGAAVLATRTGALPETTAGFGRMVDYLDDKAQMAANYAAMVVDTLTGMQRDPDAAERQRAAQIAHVRTNAVWPVRAREWQGWLAEIVARGV
jgi:glycosyltransferase involved in cell wall biosynthesis